MDTPTSDDRSTVDPIKLAIGARLKEHREAAGLSADEAGRLLGYETKNRRKTVSAWENGRGSPDLATLRAICREYSCSADALLWAHDEERPFWTGQLTAETVGRLARLPGPQWANLETMVRAFLDTAKVPAAPVKRQRAGAE